jgi:hypothetical protein
VARPLNRATRALVVEDPDEDNSLSEISASAALEDAEDALLAAPVRYPYGFNRSSAQFSSPRPAASVVSIPTRGWDSPGASVLSAPVGIPRQPRVAGRPPMCFICYQPGHLLTDCPHLPGPVRDFAIAGRSRYLGHQPSGLSHQGEGTTRGASTPTSTGPVATPKETALIEEGVQGPPAPTAVIPHGPPKTVSENFEGSA